MDSTILKITTDTSEPTMIFDSLLKKTNLADLKTAYQNLCKKYEKLHAEKQTAIKAREREIKKLSKKITEWADKYEELEASIPTNSQSSSEHLNPEFIQRLQHTVAELSKRNHRLSQELSEQIKSKKSFQLKTHETGKRSKKGSSSKRSYPTNGKAGKTQNAFQTDTSLAKGQKEDTKAQREPELCFSPDLQALLNKHANQS